MIADRNLDLGFIAYDLIHGDQNQYTKQISSFFYQNHFFNFQRLLYGYIYPTMCTIHAIIDNIKSHQNPTTNFKIPSVPHQFGIRAEFPSFLFHKIHFQKKYCSMSSNFIVHGYCSLQSVVRSSFQPRLESDSSSV